MGLPSCKFVYAWDRLGAGRRDDRCQTPGDICRSTRGWIASYLIAACLSLTAPDASAGETLRIATFNIGFKRPGPGLLLRDILRGEDAQIAVAREMVRAVAPDILLLTNIDYDHGLYALAAFAEELSKVGVPYPYLFALPPNSGVATGVDVNGDGRLGTPQDAQSYGEFAGQGGMALLSRFPIDRDNVRDFSGVLWKDFPGANLPADSDDVIRLSSTAHWDVPVVTENGNAIHLLAYHAMTPVFDGPEDRNGWRNHDENVFWADYLDGETPFGSPPETFVILGDANLDPVDGEGRQEAISGLLGHKLVQDARPRSNGATEASLLQRGANMKHRGDPSLDTADWRDVDGPGNLRVDYVLPSTDLEILDAGVFWPASGEPLADLLSDRDVDVSWHGLVWVDIRW